MSTFLKVGSSLVCTGLTLIVVSPVADQDLNSLRNIDQIVVPPEDQPEIMTALVSWYSMQSVLKAGDCGITASGEKFKEEKLTFAYWHFDFGTEVEFRNPKTGRSIIARCNDRGPAKRLIQQGRIFDLSKRAFSEIEKLAVGITKIEWKVIQK